MSSAGRRVIPLPPILVDALRRHREATRHDPFPFGLVWSTSDGGPILTRDDLAAWHALLQCAGVPRRPRPRPAPDHPAPEKHADHLT